MSEAHKTPCDDPSCPQTVCENRNAHLGGFSQAANTELKNRDKETARLRAQVSALKAENEAAVKNMAALQSELAAFKNWQPSDPGTKEAMEIAAKNEADRNKMGWKPEGWERALGTLADSLRAAMVRLEDKEEAAKAPAAQPAQKQGEDRG